MSKLPWTEERGAMLEIMVDEDEPNEDQPSNLVNLAKRFEETLTVMELFAIEDPAWCDAFMGGDWTEKTRRDLRRRWHDWVRKHG